MVEEVVPRDGNKIRGSLGVKHTIVVVLISGNTFIRELAVVDPDVGCFLDVDQVAALGGQAEV